MLIHRYWRTVIGMWWLIALCGAIGILGGLATVLTQTRDSEATVLVRVDAPTDNQGAEKVSTDDLLSTISKAAVSKDVLTLATNSDTTLTAAQMKHALHITTIANTNVLTIAAVVPSMNTATRIAQADVDALLTYEANQAKQTSDPGEQTLISQISAAQKALDDANTQIEQLRQQGVPETDPSMTTLQAQLTQDTENLRKLQGNLLQVQYAASLNNPSLSIVRGVEPMYISPQQALMKPLLLGGGVGFGFGMLAATAGGRRRRVRRLEPFTALTGKAVLLRVPGVPPNVMLRNPWEDPHLVNIFSSLRVDLTFAESGQAVKSLAILGESSQAGASFVAAMVAEQWAQAGKRVLIVDAHPSEPIQHVQLGVSPTPGLADALFHVRDDTLDIRPYLRSTQRRFTMVLPAGEEKTLSDRTVMLPEFGLLMDTLYTSGAEMLILDAPPLSNEAAALAVARRAEGVILVVDGGICTASQLEASLLKLREAAVNLVAVVLNAPPSTRHLGPIAAPRRFSHRPANIPRVTNIPASGSVYSGMRPQR